MRPMIQSGHEPDSPLFPRSGKYDIPNAWVIADTYRVLRLIGSGGSSRVFEVEHVRLGKRFAVKLLRQGCEGTTRTVQRFRREMRAIASIRSEHVVSAVDCGTLDDGTPYLVMDLLAGEDLRSLLNRSGPLPMRRTLHLLQDACHGVDAVHAVGLVHRDLKPENLFVTRRAAGEDFCVVLDFGIAKTQETQLTAPEAVVGTVRYMAPEQLADSAAVGPATDVYALAAILYECLAGLPVHGGATTQEVMYSVMNREPVPLAEVCPALPAPLSQLVMQCLSKEPSDRPATAEELRVRLSKMLDTPASLDETLDEADRPASESALPTRTSPHQGWMRLAPAAAALAFGLIGGLAVASSRPHSPADRRQQPRRIDDAPVTATIQASRPREPVEAQCVSVPPAASLPVAVTNRAQLTPSHRAVPVAKASATLPAPIGKFDPANPYGEP